MRCLQILLIAALAMVVLSVSTSAAVPQLINYQGRLTTPAGQVVTDGNYLIRFRIYDASTGGTTLWDNGFRGVPVAGGLFSYLLGDSTALPDDLFATDTVRYLGVTVGADAEMTPRVRLTAAAYGYQSLRCDSAYFATSGGGWIDDGSVVRLASVTDKVGIGTNWPTEQLELTENLALPASTSIAGVLKIGGKPFLHGHGTDNIFVGADAGNLTTSGTYNTAVGHQALANVTGGNANAATGRQALLDNTIGYDNTAMGVYALMHNVDGHHNTASGFRSLRDNASGYHNCAFGDDALIGNTTGFNNTAIGYLANVSSGNLFNATAIGANATVNASNKIRLGNTAVTVIEGQVAYTWPSDRNQKENFQQVDGSDVLEKIGHLNISSWNYKGHDPKLFRHYGPMAQDFFAAFGDDGTGQIGDSVTLNAGDLAGITLAAVKELLKQNQELKIRNSELDERLQKLESLLANPKQPNLQHKGE